jgi:putative nucleotidyltransferase with HDIG domain
MAAESDPEQQGLPARTLDKPREPVAARKLLSALAVCGAYVLALSGVGLVVGGAIHSKPATLLSLLPLLGLLAVLTRGHHQRMQSLVELDGACRSLAELNAAYRGTALVLGDVIEADDGYSGDHSKGVVALALAVADELGLQASQRRNLEFAALLHDVGKIAIPRSIAGKPGTLKPQEWAIIKTHTVEGQKMLEGVGGFMRDVGLIVRSHHERWDGWGYPDGLAGEAIPLESRILTVCDAWHAMCTNRPYRKALAEDVALAELQRNAGLQFDPRIVQAVVRVLAPRATPQPVVAVHPGALPSPLPAH